MSSRGISAIVFGFVFLSSPYLVGQIPIEFNYPLMAKIGMMINGVFIGLSGLVVDGADGYEALLDFHAVIAAVLMLTGPLSNYPVGMEFWMTMTFTTGIFLGFPTFMLLRLSKKQS